jgi:translation initiation factor IF-2
MPAQEQPSRKLRPPVIVIMGHVDHGKTTLLDHIRKANVAGREAGGITQAISAYQIDHNGKLLTFIDTPGHEAFTGMRTRGANVADLAILVVAATEGVKPQTQEAIQILKKSETPFVVAITKMDMPSANVDKVKNELTTADVLLEGYGGSVSFQPVSAVSGEGVSELLDLVVLATDFEELTYNAFAPAAGFVLESRLNRQRGLEAVLIIKEGTLAFGNNIGTATAKGKVKILEDFTGKAQKEIGAGSPAIVVGFEILPRVGEAFGTGGAEVAGAPIASESSKTEAAGADLPIDNADIETFPIVLKAADQGSLEVLSQIIRAMPSEKPIKILSESVGEITDNDLKLAIPTHAVIIGFKTKVDKAATTLMEAHDIRLLTSDIIYELTQGLEKIFQDAQGPSATGLLEVLAVFNQKELKEQLVGGRLTEGVFRLKAQVEIRRGDEVVGRGRVLTMRQQKQTLEEASAVTEIGLLVNSPVEIAVGDVLAIIARS